MAVFFFFSHGQMKMEVLDIKTNCHGAQQHLWDVQLQDPAKNWGWEIWSWRFNFHQVSNAKSRRKKKKHRALWTLDRSFFINISQYINHLQRFLPRIFVSKKTNLQVVAMARPATRMHTFPKAKPLWFLGRQLMQPMPQRKRCSDSWCFSTLLFLHILSMEAWSFLSFLNVVCQASRSFPWPGWALCPHQRSVAHAPTSRLSIQCSTVLEKCCQAQNSETGEQWWKHVETNVPIPYSSLKRCWKLHMWPSHWLFEQATCLFSPSCAGHML